MTGLETALHCGIISLLWGATNPLIKKSTSDITKVQAKSLVHRFINEVKYLAANWTYVLLFLVNQIGSVLYLLLLQNADLSLVVPTVNSLTFIVTGFVGSVIEENKPNLRTLLGVVLILTGITFCVFDKVQKTDFMK